MSAPLAAFRRVAALATLTVAPVVVLAGDPPRDGRHDFDFLLGNWTVHLRRLPDRLVGSTQWIDYKGQASVRPFVGGHANIEEFEVQGSEPGQHLKAQTLRLYDPSSDQWSLHLLDVDHGQLMLPPTVGRFTDGRGEFFDMEPWKGRQVLVRYVWTHEASRSARMEQAFSQDGGRTWEVNWICDMMRED
jgi:hypothetical protein